MEADHQSERALLPYAPAVSERTESYREWVVYRAISDFDAARGDVAACRVGDLAAEREAAQQGSNWIAPAILFRGANQVVYLLTDPQALIRTLGWKEPQDAPA